MKQYFNRPVGRLLGPAILGLTLYGVACQAPTPFATAVTSSATATVIITTTPTAVPSVTASSTSSATGTASSVATPTPSASAANVMALVVNTGPYGGQVDVPFTSVQICTPGSSTACQTVSGILIDSGSYGLRIFASVLSGESLPAVTSAGNPVGDCVAFADGSVGWGPVVTAGVSLAGEPQVSVPIQLFAQSSFAPAPVACTSQGSTQLVSPNAPGVGFNGILGIGLFPRDDVSAYFGCTGASCSEITTTASQQIENPVVALPVDNNGSMFSFPTVGTTGSATLNGSVVLGIGTEANNGLGSATVYTTNAQGNISTVYKGTTLSSSFIDSGSNGLFFPDSTITGCTGAEAGFYCPAATLSLSAQNTGANGNTGAVSFSLANAVSLFATGNTAFNNLGGTLPGISGAFDFGLPFMLGRNVFFGIQGQSTPGGGGPYFAY